MAASPYAAAPPEKLAEIIREAEALLEAQLSLAAGADQRALTFAGLLVAAVGALIGAASATSSSGLPAGGILVVSTILFVAACLALWSARPTPWGTVGNEPSSWVDDIAEGADSLHEGMAAMAGYYDAKISANYLQIERAAKAMKCSMILTVTSMTGALVWLGSRLS